MIDANRSFSSNHTGENQLVDERIDSLFVTRLFS